MKTIFAPTETLSQSTPVAANTFAVEIAPYIDLAVRAGIMQCSSADLMEMHQDWLTDAQLYRVQKALQFFGCLYAKSAVRVASQLPADPPKDQAFLKAEADQSWTEFLNWALIRSGSLDTDIGRQLLDSHQSQMNANNNGWLVGPDDPNFRIPVTLVDHDMFQHAVRLLSRLASDREESSVILSLNLQDAVGRQHCGHKNWIGSNEHKSPIRSTSTLIS